MLSNVFLHLHPVRIRKSGVKLRYTWCMGGLSFFLFLSLTLTGLLLMFYYRPTLEYAYTDIVGLREHVPLGIMREMHRWGAHAMVITVWLHMFRVFMTGSYKAAARVQLVGRRHHAGADAAAVVHRLPAAVGSAGDLGHHGRLEHGARDAVPRPRRARAPRCCGSATCRSFTPPTMRGSRCSAARSSAKARCCGSTCCTASACRSCIRGADGRAFLARPQRRRHFGTTLENFEFVNLGNFMVKGIFNAIADPRLFFLLAVAALVLARLEARADRVERGRLRRARVSGGVLHLRHLRSELPADRHQAGQRPDRRPHLPARLLRLVLDPRRRAERPPDRGGAGADREGGVRSRVGLARPRLHRAHFADRLLGDPDRLVDLPEGAARAAGQPGEHAEPVEGAVVFPRPAGNARLLRSVAGRRRAAGPHHRRADLHSPTSTRTRRATATTRSRSGRPRSRSSCSGSPCSGCR